MNGQVTPFARRQQKGQRVRIPCPAGGLMSGQPFCKYQLGYSERTAEISRQNGMSFWGHCCSFQDAASTLRHWRNASDCLDRSPVLNTHYRGNGCARYIFDAAMYRSDVQRRPMDHQSTLMTPTLFCAGTIQSARRNSAVRYAPARRRYPVPRRCTWSRATFPPTSTEAPPFR